MLSKTAPHLDVLPEFYIISGIESEDGIEIVAFLWIAAMDLSDIVQFADWVGKKRRF